MTQSATITVPEEVLNNHVEPVETFFSLVASAPLANQYTIDLAAVDFIRPYGVIALVSAARALFERCGKPVTLANIREKVHGYLERVDLFMVGEQWLRADKPPTEVFDRDQPTPSLLELTRVTSATDVSTVIAQADRIFSYWLHVRNLRSLLNVLSELCANIYQHSHDANGVVLIQTHRVVSKNEVHVRVALGDAGRGVQASLQSHFGDLGADSLDYLQAAMGGRTSRKTGRGGLGLRLVEQTVGEDGGYMWLRSGTAAICSHGPGRARGLRDLAPVAGTQLAVDFHAPLPDDFREG